MRRYIDPQNLRTMAVRQNRLRIVAPIDRLAFWGLRGCRRTSKNRAENPLFLTRANWL